MESNRLKQEESLQRREELLRELEVIQQMTARDKAEEERRKQETKREFEAQVCMNHDMDLDKSPWFAVFNSTALFGHSEVTWSRSISSGTRCLVF